MNSQHFFKGKLLDVGCGYGPMGLSFAKANSQMSVEMVDVNERYGFGEAECRNEWHSECHDLRK